MHGHTGECRHLQDSIPIPTGQYTHIYLQDSIYSCLQDSIPTPTGQYTHTYKTVYPHLQDSILMPTATPTGQYTHAYRAVYPCLQDSTLMPTGQYTHAYRTVHSCLPDSTHAYRTVHSCLPDSTHAYRIVPTPTHVYLPNQAPECASPPGCLWCRLWSPWQWQGWSW